MKNPIDLLHKYGFQPDLYHYSLLNEPRNITYARGLLKDTYTKHVTWLSTALTKPSGFGGSSLVLTNSTDLTFVSLP